MSGFKDNTWKKWKASKTTSPVAVTDKKSIESISSQRSSSLLRSRKRRTKQDAVDDVGFFRLAAENRGKPIPRPLIDCEGNKLEATDIQDQYDAEHKNGFRDKKTSPFNTRAPTNQLCRENTIIVQYGKLEDGKANSPTDSSKSDDLWRELPSSDVAASPKPGREKGPKGGSKRPASPKKSRPKKSGSSGTPTNEKSQHPTTPQAHVHPPPKAPPQPEPGPPVSHHPPPQSGQSQHPRTSPSSNPVNNLCDLTECPARGPKQKERLCMAPECPVTMKKAVVKEAKRAVKRSCGKKRKNPLTILGAVLMSAFTGNGSTCKLTKQEKKALKRMKAQEDGDDSCNLSGRSHKKSVGVQCKAPLSKKNDQPQKRPRKADKSTTCNIPECPIVKQKSKIKEFMDKGQLCEIPNCPIKKPPPPQIEKKVEPPKGCPAKPCTLKSKDEAFLKTLGPCIYEKIPRLKMTCDETHAGGNGGRSQPHHAQPAQPAMKSEDKPAADKAKERDKGVKIVTAHVHVPPPVENPFQATITNPLELLGSSESPGHKPDGNHVSADKESECQKLGNRSAPGFIFGVKADEVKYKESTAANLCQKKKLVIGSEDGSTSKRSMRRFSNISVYHNVSLKMTGTPETNRPIGSGAANFLAQESVKVVSEESLGITIKPNDSVRTLPRHETLLDVENGLKTAQSNFFYTYSDDPIMTNVTSRQTRKDPAVKKFPALVSGAEKARSKDMEMHPFDPIVVARHGNAKVEGMAQDFQASKSYSLIKKSARNMQKSDFPLDLEDKWRVVTVLPVKYPSAYSATSNHVLKDPLDLRTPTSDVKSLRRNWNNVKNSKASVADEINSLLSTCWKTNNKTEDIGNILKEDSTNKNSQHSSEDLLVENFSSFEFRQRINGQSEFGNISDDIRFKEMIEIFVAEPARATILQQQSDREHRLSKTKSKAESSTRILHESSEAKCSFETAEPSRETQSKKPRLCLYVRQGENDAEKPGKGNISGQQTVKTDERTCKPSFSENSHFDVTFRKPITANRVSTAQSNRLDNSKATNGTRTQTLATSAISPINVQTIGVGSTSIIGLGSQHSVFR